MLPWLLVKNPLPSAAIAIPLSDLLSAVAAPIRCSIWAGVPTPAVLPNAPPDANPP